MSINWVMLDSTGKDFVRLPHEKVLITSPPRTSIALTSPNSYPGKEPVNIKASDGRAIITNQRLIYLPATSAPSLQSLSIPHLSLQDTHVSAPFFGPNSWDGLVLPTPGGGFPASCPVIQIKLTFREGGAYDFQSTFERIKEMASLAREEGRFTDERVGGGAGVVDLDELPAYTEAAGLPPPQQQQPGSLQQRDDRPQGLQRPVPIAPNGERRTQPPIVSQSGNAGGAAEPTPNEPPPGYEEVQSSTLANTLEQRLREQANGR